MAISTPPRNCMVALLTPCRNRRPAPTNTRETATVKMAADVMRRLRQRLVALSLTKYPGRMAMRGRPPRSVQGPVDATGLIANERAAIELDHASAHRVDDRFVVRG